MPRSSKWSVPIRFSYQNPVHISSFPDTCYMPHPSHMSCQAWALQLHFTSISPTPLAAKLSPELYKMYFISIWHYDLEHKHGDSACAHAHTHTHHARTFVTRIHHLNGTYIKCLLIWHTVCWLTEQWLTVTLINQSINVFISVDLIYQIWKMS